LTDLTKNHILLFLVDGLLAENSRMNGNGSGNMTTTAATQALTERFTRLVKQWKSECRYMSNLAQMAILRSYQNIIGMGDPAIPLILQELKKETDHWFWALEAITGENPVRNKSAGKVELMAQAWVEWGIKKGYIA
jgi:hypothetical protein